MVLTRVHRTLVREEAIWNIMDELSGHLLFIWGRAQEEDGVCFEEMTEAKEFLNDSSANSF